jgi:hypothetical protein
MQDIATSTILGRASTSSGDPEALTAAQVRTIINVADGANAYVHPNHSGDVTSTGDGATTITANAVTFTKIQDIASQTILGRTTASTGDPEALTATQVRTMINVADGANNYIHPATHAATMITEDATHRFVTDTDKTNWDGKVNRAGDNMTGVLSFGGRFSIGYNSTSDSLEIKVI